VPLSSGAAWTGWDRVSLGIGHPVDRAAPGSQGASLSRTCAAISRAFIGSRDSFLAPPPMPGDPRGIRARGKVHRAGAFIQQGVNVANRDMAPRSRRHRRGRSGADVAARHRGAAHAGSRSDLRDVASGQRSTRRSRKALVITDTEDRLIAAAAIIGDSRRPVTG